MLSKLKNTLKHSAIYSFGNLSVKAISFLLLPLYTSYLTTEQYGILAILAITGQFLLTIFLFSLSNAIMRWWVEYKDEYERKKIVFTAFSFLVVVVAIFNAGLQPLSKTLSQIIFQTTDFSLIFSLVFISVSFEIFNKFLFAIIRIKEKSLFYIVLVAIKAVLTLSLTIYFIVGLNWGIKGIIVAQLTGHGFAFLFGLPLIFKNSVLKFNFSALWAMLGFSTPLLFTGLSSLVLSIGDRYILKFLMTDSDVGVYTLAFNLATVIGTFLLQSFQMGFLPIAYKMHKNDDAPRFFSKITTYLTLILSFATLGLTFYSKELIILLSPNNQDYWLAIPYVPLVASLAIINGLKFMMVLGLHFAKKTKYNTAIVFSGAIINVILNFALIPYLEIYGVILSSVIASIYITALNNHYSQKFYKVKFQILKIFKVILLAIAYYFLSFPLNELNIVLSLILKTALLATFPFVLYLFRFYEPIEILRAKQVFQKWKNPKNWKDNLKNIKFKDSVTK